METVSQLIASKGSQVWSVDPDETVYSAIEKMAETNTGALAVVKNEQLVSIISERDYTRKVFLQGKSSQQSLVSEIMTFPVICATMAQKIDDCMAIMNANGFRHMPVVEADKLVGMLSLKDLVNVIIQGQETIIHDLETYITG